MRAKAIGIALIIIFALVGFFGGVQYQKNQLKSQLANLQNLSGQQRVQALQQLGLTGLGGGGGRGGARFFGGGSGSSSNDFVVGQVISKDNNSITVKSQNGSTKIVFLGGSSQIVKSVAGAVSDLSVGENVMVAGTDNSDGSVTAQNVQIRPNMSGSSATQQPGQ